VTGLDVKAMNARGKVPQAYISRNEAEQACINAGKRLCTNDEWVAACKGKSPTQWPYGDEHQPGRCNDQGTSSFNLLFGKDGQPPPQSEYTFDHLNDPRLNQMKGTLAPSGSFARCKNGYGAFDMVGNLHEWTSDVGGTFRGGYYLDVRQNGLGCDYKTTAHHDKYHDYSTGFRCCKTPGAKSPQPPPVAGAKKKTEKKARGS
jgi:formylglycine-generating enzyme required for sulfatase activity